MGSEYIKKPYVEPSPTKIIEFQLPISQKLVKILERTGIMFYLPWKINAHKITRLSDEYFPSYKMQFLYKLSCENWAKNSARSIGYEIMSQPIKGNIVYCFTQSCKWSHLLICHMITYIKATYNTLDHLIFHYIK